MSDSTPKVIPLVKPSFTEKYKSKNAAGLGGVDTLLAALPVLKIGEVNDFARLHPSEDSYWSPELCFVSVPVRGSKTLLHVIDDDLATRLLPSAKIARHRLALASKPFDVFFFCIVPSQNLDNAWNASAFDACAKAQTHWVQASSRRSEGAEGYKIDFARDDKTAFPDPKWPSRSIDELLEVTFKGTNIDHENHAGLKRLIGAKQDLA